MAVVSSCARPDAVEQKARAFLQPLLHVGESPTNLIARFGSPSFKVETPSHELCLTFFFSGHDQAAQIAGVGGFDAFFVNNKLTHWNPVYQSREPMWSAQGRLLMKNREDVYKMFVQTDSLANLLETFDSNGAADAGTLKAQPDLVVEAKTFLRMNEFPTSTNATVTLIIRNQFVPRLESLTELNIGKRLLIVWSNEVIAAPLIIMPIATNQFQFSIKDLRVLKFLNE